MSSESVARIFYGEKTNTCKWCEDEYVIRLSTAYSVAEYCCGECELLGDEADVDLEESTT